MDAKHQVEQAWSGIDVLLRQRHDEVPGLIEMLGAHGSTNSALLERVGGLRGRTGSGMPDGERLASEEALSRCIRSLLDSGTGHPRLQASEAYRELQQRIGGLEEQIAQRRDHYNAAVKFNNGRMERFSSLFFNGLAGMARRPLFAAAEHDWTDIDVGTLPAQ